MNEVFGLYYVLFFKPSSEHESIIDAICNLTERHEPRLRFESIHTEYQLISRLNSTQANHECLLVTFVELEENQISLLYRKGSPFLLMWDEFLLLSSAMIPRTLLRKADQKKPTLCQVGMLFLPSNFQSILTGIFRIYGFQPRPVISMSALERMEPENISHIILDQDLVSLKVNYRKIGHYREKVITHIKKMLIENQSITVFVVKNFEQGSLFEDITSSVKDICNLLLSHEEYLLFIKKFLETIEMQKFMQERYDSSQNIRVSHFQESVFSKKPLAVLEKPQRSVFSIYRN